MEIGIVGLPKSGKTTIFHALTRGKAAASHSPGMGAVHLGVARVPDRRLLTLQKIFQPKKVVPAEVKYADMADAPREFGKGQGISGPFLSYLMNADALLEIVRAFSDPGVPYLNGGLDPKHNIAVLDMELTFSDLTIVERRLQKIDESLKGARQTEREAYENERTLLRRIKLDLVKEIPIRRQELTPTEIRSLSNYQFLTAKPILLVINLGEEQLSRASSLVADIASSYAYPRADVIALPGKLEMELAQLDEKEAFEFRQSMGLGEPAFDQVSARSFKLLGLITFFTTVSGELKAWTIVKGTTAVRAAGKIHSDMERGFIRAEVISFQDLEKAGSLTEARSRGLLRAEGKEYIVQDGDVITFLFHV